VIAFPKNCSLLARSIGQILHFLLNRGYSDLGDLLFIRNLFAKSSAICASLDFLFPASTYYIGFT
jgi:hypothetical protein